MRHVVFFIVTLALAPLNAAAGAIYNINIDTAPLVGDVAQPFYLAFQLADGSGTGDGNNAAFISGFVFDGGGAPFGSPLTLGSAFGDLSSSVILTDSGFPNVFAQAFTPGTNASFQLALTANVDPGFVADEFTVSILDQTLTPIPTSVGPFFDALLAITIDAQNPTIEVFSGDTSRSPTGGGPPIAIRSPEVVQAPEPDTIAGALLAGFFALSAHFRTRWRKRRNEGLV
jgi:hypothetical protein